MNPYKSTESLNSKEFSSISWSGLLVAFSASLIILLLLFFFIGLFLTCLVNWH